MIWTLLFVLKLINSETYVKYLKTG